MRAAAWLALCSLCASTAAADDTLRACVDEAAQAMEARGARRVGETVVGFLREGEARSVPFTLEEAGCVGVLAVGHRRVHDLDLVLQTDSGMTLAEDVEVDARPYLRFCGAAGLRLVATVQMYKGRGEFRLVRFADAPATLPDLHRTLGGCFAGGGGMRRASADVGPAPPGRALPERLARLDGDLGDLGYRALGLERSGSLSAPQREAHPLSLEAGRCYAVVAVGDLGVADLDVSIRTAAGRELARDVARDAAAVTRLCVGAAEPLVAEVRMFQGSGAYRLRVMALDERRTGERPPGVEGFARIGHAELRARMTARGMAARPLGWGLIGPGQALGMPVELEAGKCYAFGGAPADEVQAGDLDLILVDEDEALLAWDVGPGNVPLVWHCAERSGAVRVVGRVYGAAGRYLVLMGEQP